MKHVATVAVIHRGHILLGKRRDTGKWTNPGGHLRPGEAPSDAAARELHEETGIQVHPTALAPLLTRMVHPGLIVHAFYHAPSDRPVTTMRTDPDTEVHRWHWLPLESLPADDDLHVPRDRNLVLQHFEGGSMSKLTADERKDLDASQFAVPGKQKLPINDASHVRDAMARFHETEGLTADEKATARQRILAAAKKFDIDASGFEKGVTDTPLEAFTDAVVATEYEVLTDSTAEGSDGILRVRWCGTRSNIRNTNARMYPDSLMDAAVEEAVRDRVKPGLMIGESPHPREYKGPDGQVVYDTKVENSVIRIYNLEKKGHKVFLDAEVLDTAKGKDVQALVRRKVPVGVSMRALGGGVKRYLDGVQTEVATTLRIESFDVVMNPATNGCNEYKVLTDSQVERLLEDNTPESPPESPPVADAEPINDGLQLSNPDCPSCGASLQPQDPDGDGDVDFFTCGPCSAAYVADHNLQQTTTCNHTLSKVTPTNYDAYPLAQQWLSQQGTPMTDSVNNSGKEINMDTLTQTPEFNAAVTEKATAIAQNLIQPITDHIAAQKQAEAKTQATAQARTEAKAFLDSKMDTLKDRYDEKTLAVIRDSIGEPPTKEQAEALFDASVRLASKANAKAFLDSTGYDADRPQPRGHVRVEVGQEAQPWMPHVQKILDACDELNEQCGETIDPALRAYNRKHILERKSANMAHPETLGRSLVDHITEAISHKDGMSLTDSTKAFTDAIEHGSAFSDAIGITTSNLLNQPTISMAVLFEIFQDVESLQFMMTEIFKGSELRVPLETFQGAAAYNATNFLSDLLVAEGVGIPSGTVTLAYQSFSPSWRRNAVSLSKDVVRQLQSGPVSYPAIARAIYNITQEKRRKLDLVAYNEMITASDAFGSLVVTNEVPATAGAVAAASGVLVGTTNAAYYYKLVPGTTTYEAPTYSAGAAFGGNPVVRPRTVNTINAGGSATSTTSYPVTIGVTGGVTQVQGAWDGQNIQSVPGTTATFAVDYEHGIVYFKATGTSGVNPTAGTPVLPNGISYTASQNFDRWHTTMGSGYTDVAAWYDTFLQQLTKTSALMGSSPRFRKPNLAIFSLNAAAYVENARIFYKFAQPDGTKLLDTGNTFGQRAGMNLSRINAPWGMADGRVLLTQRGSTRYGIETPYDMEGPYPVYDSSQNIVDAKLWYGSENSAMATPIVTDSNGVQYNPAQRSIVIEP